MRPLPVLATGTRRWTLPMSDRSAAAVMEALLCGEGDRGAGALAEALAADPPFLVWSLCMAGTKKEDPSKTPANDETTAGAARWLVEHLLEVFDWEREARAASGAPESWQSDCFGEQVAADLRIAALAGLLAAPDGQTVAGQAHLIGLVRHARDWLALVSGRTCDAAADRLLEPVDALGRHPAAAYATQAEQLLDGHEARAKVQIEPCRASAEQGRARWLENLAGPLARLPQLTHALRRLAELETRFQETLEQEKLAAMAELAAGAGHEINNPLTVIGGRAQLLLKQETDPERRRELALINAQVKRAYEMIADLRLFARPPRPEPRPFDLVALVEQILADMAPLAAERATTLARSGDAGPVEIVADPVQLSVALRALCANSLEAIGHDGHVEVEVRRSGEDVVIRVADDGPGILPEQRRHLFDPFYSARQAGRGLGLGLSKCWRIVTGHGGRIDVEGQPGQGAVFTITLPLAASQ
jgi:signal transduction histidine kinase